MVLAAPSRMVRRVLQCPSKWGISSSCCSCAFSACWGSVNTILIFDQAQLSACMPLGFISRGMDWHRHLLGYHGQLFLHYCWQTYIDRCLLGFLWGMVAGSE